MKVLRRKRTTSTSSPSPAPAPGPSAPAPKAHAVSAPSPDPPTPLYARFASTHPKPVVSGPIALAPRAGAGHVQRGPSFQSEREREREELLAREREREERERARARERQEREREREKERQERERERERERQEREREREKAVAREKSKPTNKREPTLKREVGLEREVQRMPSRGEALRGGAGAPTGSEEAGEARTPGERVLLPARKVTRRKEAGGEAEMHGQRADMAREPSPVKKSEAVENAGRDEQMRVAGERVLLPARKVTRRRIDVEDRRDSPSAVSTPDYSSRDPHAQEYLSDSHSPYHLPAGSVTTRAVVVNAASGADGWEDKFSTPKRGPASPTSAAPSFPRLPLDFPRPSLDHSKFSEVSMGTTASSTSSTQPSRSSLDNQVRVVGERVLLPARKVTRRRAEPAADTESSPERGRTMSSTRRSHIRSMHKAVSDVSDGPGPLDPGPLAFPASEAAHRDDTLATPKATPVEAPAAPHPVPRPRRSLSPSRPSLPAANPSETSTSTQSSGAAPTSSDPVVAPVPSQTSTSSVEGDGRPPRRRKYSLLAAFGLHSASRTASESDTSAATPAQDTKAPPAAPPAPAAPLSAPPSAPAPASDTEPGAEDARSVAGSPRERLASNARRAPADVHLQSLHLSGFNFPLDALLADPDADPDPPEPPPPMPVRPSALQPPPSPRAHKRRSIVDTSPALSHSQSPLKQASAATHPSPPPPLPQPSSKAPQVPYPSPPPPPPPPHAAPAEVRPPPAPLPRQAQKPKPNARAIELDQSVLSPASDTRYPLPSRRSPPAQTSQQTRTHQDKSSTPTPPPMKPSLSRSSPSRSSPMRSDPSAAVANARGPVQRRPLIFAAMEAAEMEAEIVEPTAWMAVATSDSEDSGGLVQTEHSNGSSQFVNGYPTPRSASPRLPAPMSDFKDEDSGASKLGHSLSHYAAPQGHEREDDARHASPPIHQSHPNLPGNLPTPPEVHPPRPRKLSKSRARVTRMADTSQPPSQPEAHAQMNGHAPNTLGAKPPTPVDDAPPARTREGPSRPGPKPHSASATGREHLSNPSSALGSPFQMRAEKYPADGRNGDSRSPPRVISSESPVPTRPVKMLTSRQMEKLSATKGMQMHGSNGVPSQQRRPEPPVPVKSPPPRNKSLPLQTPPDEPPVVQMSRSGSTQGSPPGSPKKHPQEIPNGTPPQELQDTPQEPEDYAHARSRRRGKALEKARPEGIEDVPPATDPLPEDLREPTFYPIEKHVAEPAMLGQLLIYLSFTDWLALSSVNKAIRTLLEHDRELTERVLERYLRTVGYSRWTFPEHEPLALTLPDLNAYMHGVSLPQHQFARHAETFLQSRDRRHRDLIQSLQVACRSYTRVVLRLRAQAEADARVASANMRDRARSPGRGWGGSSTSVNHIPNQHPTPKKSFSRSSSRAPSPTSMFSHSQHAHFGHSRAGSLTSLALHHSQSHAHLHGPGGAGAGGFQSPLFRLRRAPLLQVFVPSPDGDWLSDASVLECEKELKRAGVTHLLRAGDVVWDAAVGDEGNVGRMVWDGSYLIDLDYAYSRSGDLPKYLPTLAFPPSYFHRVVRTMGAGNPICHIDIAPWGEEIANNLQLLQDRMKTETPQGGHHMVVRWVHRSTFTIRPPASGKPLRASVPKCVGPGPAPGGVWLVDAGWYGTVVVEAEGTNEGLADLQERCRGAFPVRATGAAASLGVSPERAAREEERRNVFRILREKSRPGEIWIRTVTAKERLLAP